MRPGSLLCQTLELRASMPVFSQQFIIKELTSLTSIQISKWEQKLSCLGIYEFLPCVQFFRSFIPPILHRFTIADKQSVMTTLIEHILMKQFGLEDHFPSPCPPPPPRTKWRIWYISHSLVNKILTSMVFRCYQLLLTVDTDCYSLC